MTLITKVSLQMTFLWDCTRASILCLHNCPAELVGSCHGSWWSLHSSEGKRLLPSENPAPAPQASLAAAQGGLCSLRVLPECQCPQGTCSAAVTWVSLSLPRGNSAWSSNIHTCKCLWNSFLLGDDCLGQSWRPLMMNSREKWASLGMVVKIMISSFSGEAMLTKLKWQ